MLVCGGRRRGKDILDSLDVRMLSLHDVDSTFV